MSHYVCSIFETGACADCCKLNAFRYRSNLQYKMWQRQEYRDAQLWAVQPWEYGLVLKSRALAKELGQLRLTCKPPGEVMKEKEFTVSFDVHVYETGTGFVDGTTHSGDVHLRVKAVGPVAAIAKVEATLGALAQTHHVLSATDTSLKRKSCIHCGGIVTDPDLNACDVCFRCIVKDPAAAVAYVTQHDGKILCVWNKRYGKWGFPGGKVEPKDRSPREACIREVHEETGMNVESAELIFEGPHNEIVESTRGSYVYVYRVRFSRRTNMTITADQPREMEPGCAVTWLTREEFLKWGLAPKFYERMFQKIDHDARGALLARDGGR